MMDSFDERFKRKSDLDDQMLSRACQDLAGVVTGVTRRDHAGFDPHVLKSVMDAIAKELQIKPALSVNPESTVESYLEDYFRPQGIMWREVKLKDNWYKNATGVMLGTLSDGSHTALIGKGTAGCLYLDPISGKRNRVTKDIASQIEPRAILLYQSLPLRVIDTKDVRHFIMRCISKKDLLLFLVSTLLVTVFGMASPALSKILLSSVVEENNLTFLFWILILLVEVTVVSYLLTVIKQLLLARMSTKIAVPLQAAFMMRALTAPTGQIKGYSSGDLGNRIGTLYSYIKTILGMFLSMLITAVCSLICFVQMFIYSSLLGGIALVFTIGLGILYIWAGKLQYQVSTERMEAKAQESGLTYSILEGMQKITVSGAEKRSFSKWAGVYRRSINTLYNPPLLLKVFSMLTPVILLAANIIMYGAAVGMDLDTASYFAFSGSFGIVTSILLTISVNLLSFADALPVIRNLKPVMDMRPETQAGTEVVKSLTGNLQLQHVSFRYDVDAPKVIDDISLDIKAGEFIAIVGRTGCGKSTLMKLMMGLERPDTGEVYYDGKPLGSLDITSLRRNVGTVMQQGDIFEGTIFSNITIGGSGLSEEDAWEAARIAGIEEDIRRMPMMMNTPLPAGGKGVSGGQRQRLMLARAIVTKPKIIFLDEATSALDNITQKAVSDAISLLGCTRIIIAHRLSTIQNCDRIILLNEGKIEEEGTFEELMKKDGEFLRLVKRQL